MPEEFLGQILVEGRWTDYARANEQDAKAWFDSRPAGTALVVDWIDKSRVIFA